MRALILIAAFVVAPSFAADDFGILGFSDSMLKASAGALAPLQMPDGSKVWRFSTKELKGEEIEMRLTDLIAQGLARAQWCSNGWEETKRSVPSRGFLLVEGRCK